MPLFPVKGLNSPVDHGAPRRLPMGPSKTGRYVFPLVDFKTFLSICEAVKSYRTSFVWNPLDKSFSAALKSFLFPNDFWHFF